MFLLILPLTQLLSAINKLQIKYFFSELFLIFLEDLLYDKIRGKKAYDKLMGANWSIVFCAYLQRIDFSENGTWAICFADERESIVQDLEEEYPQIHSIDRVVLQWCCVLATWRYVLALKILNN